jgi:hypothetical protein
MYATLQPRYTQLNSDVVRGKTPVGKTLTSIIIIVTAKLITQEIPRSNLWASLGSSETNQSGPVLPRPLRGVVIIIRFGA